MKIELLTKAYKTHKLIITTAFLDETESARYVCVNGVIKGIVYPESSSNNWKSLKYDPYFKTKEEATIYVIDECDKVIEHYTEIKKLT